MQLTVAMGRAADEPELLLEPYQMLEVMPMLARLKTRADEAEGPHLARQQHRLLRAVRVRCCAARMPRGHMASCGAGRSTLGIEANGDIKGCPSLPTADYVGGNIREHTLRDIWERAAPLRFTRDRTVEDLWGYCRTCYYADTCRAGCSWTSHVLFGTPRQQPVLPPPRARAAPRGQARAPRARRGRAGRRRSTTARFEIVVEPCPEDELERARELARTGEGSLG